MIKYQPQHLSPPFHPLIFITISTTHPKHITHHAPIILTRPTYCKCPIFKFIPQSSHTTFNFDTTTTPLKFNAA